MGEFVGQTSYNLQLNEAIAGMLADNSASSIEAAVADEAIGFGLGVVAGASSTGKTLTGGSVKLPDANTDVFRGVTKHMHKENSYPYSAGSSAYGADEVVDVVRKGRIWVQIDGTCTTDGAVYITTAGKFTSTQGSNTTATTGVFRKVDSTNSLAILEINLP